MILVIILVAIIVIMLYYHSQKNESYVNVIQQLPKEDERKICPFVTRLDDPIMDSYTDSFDELYAKANANGNIIIKDDEGYPKPYTPQISRRDTVMF